MTDVEKNKKHLRLEDRIDELNLLNEKIGKLTFYLNENKVENQDCALMMQKQLDLMIELRDVLQNRIAEGYY